MVEKTSSLYLLVLLAMSDHELHKSEVIKINQIAHDLHIKFNVNDAAEEINTKFRDDFDSACDLYMSNIQDDKVKKDSIKFMKEIAIADTKLHDREIKFLAKCKTKWGPEYFSG